MRYKILYILGGLLLLAACFFLMALPSSRPSSEIVSAEVVASSPAAPSTVFQDEDFSSTLPLFCIDNGNAAIEHGIPGWSSVTLIDNASGVNHPTDEPAYSVNSTIWVRGQSSSLFDKKSYGVEFFEEDSKEKKADIPVFGMALGCDWVLHGPYLDKSLMRNALSYHLARETMFWAPDTRFCELFLNGEYQGIYLVVESPRINENRITMADFALLSGETPYLLQRNRVDSETTPLNSYGLYTANSFYPLYVRYPVDSRLTEDQFNWIESDINTFERTLYADYYLDETRGYQSYIDMNSFVTYYIIMEFACLKDAGFLSTYCCKDINGKLKMGPVWDFNNGYDNYNGFPTFPDARGDGFAIADNNWYARMVQDRDFVDAVVSRYRELRQGVLSTAYIFSYLDEKEAYLGDAIARNSERWIQSFSWSYLGNDENGVPRDLGSYEAAREQLRSFIEQRGAYLDENITLLYHGCVN